MPGPSQPPFNPHGFKQKPADPHGFKQKPAVVGDGVKPGTVTSPIKPFKVKGVKDVKVAGMHIGSVDVDSLRQFLIHKGYDLPHEGGLGPKLKSALADFLNPSHVGDAMGAALKGTHITGNRDPQKWNTLYGSPASRPKVYRPVSGKGGLLDNNGNDVSSQYADDPSSSVDVSGLSGLGPDVLKSLPTTLAAKLADLKYGSGIKDAEAAVARQPGQAAQNEHDIAHWYDQVLGAQKTAAGRDSAMTKAGVGSVRDAVARIVSSIGGSANEGSGLVGAAGANQVGTLQALGTAEDQYNADIAPLIQDEAAGAKTRQTNLDATSAQDLERNLANLRMERGGEEASQRMGIVDFNNKVGQQTFQNELAIQQAKEAAALTGSKIIGAVTNPKLPKGAFGNTSGSQKIQIANGITSALTDQDGNLRSGWNPQRAVGFINAQLQSAGWNIHDPVVQTYRAGILKTIGLVP